MRHSLAEMRDLLLELDRSLPETTVWGLTSHDRLLLMSTPEYDRSEHHVQVYHYGDQFWVEYFPPKGRLPVSDSHIAFRASTIPELLPKLLIAMADSNGWPDAPELPCRG